MRCAYLQDAALAKNERAIKHNQMEAGNNNTRHYRVQQYFAWKDKGNTKKIAYQYFKIDITERQLVDFDFCTIKSVDRKEYLLYCSIAFSLMQSRNKYKGKSTSNCYKAEHWKYLKKRFQLLRAWQPNTPHR